MHFVSCGGALTHFPCKLGLKNFLPPMDSSIRVSIFKLKIANIANKQSMHRAILWPPVIQKVYNNVSNSHYQLAADNNWNSKLSNCSCCVVLWQCADPGHVDSDGWHEHYMYSHQANWISLVYRYQRDKTSALFAVDAFISTNRH